METGKRSLDSIFVQAEMEGTPIVIVESMQDRQIYSRLVEQFLPNKILFYPSHHFAECNANNCENVINAIEILQPHLEKDENKIRYVAGIIDRDTKAYTDKTNWERINTLQGLFILKYYSIETYFATSYNFRQVISLVTQAIITDITNERMDKLEESIANSEEILYYMGLDALKEHCLGEENHKAFKNMSSTHPAVIGAMPHFETKILPNKKGILDVFAKENEINLSYIRQVVNGKWYLFHCVTEVYNEIRKQTIFSFKVRTTPSSLYEHIMHFFDENEFEDVLTKLKKMG